MVGSAKIPVQFFCSLLIYYVLGKRLLASVVEGLLWAQVRVRPTPLGLQCTRQSGH